MFSHDRRERREEGRRREAVERDEDGRTEKVEERMMGHER